MMKVMAWWERSGGVITAVTPGVPATEKRWGAENAPSGGGRYTVCFQGLRELRSKTMVGSPRYVARCHSRKPHFSATRMEAALSG
jgi:hypothetical protein